jgi:hypothetical protein
MSLCLVTDAGGVRREGARVFSAPRQASFTIPSFFAGIAAIMLWGFLLDQITIHLRDRVVFWQSDKSRV